MLIISQVVCNGLGPPNLADGDTHAVRERNSFWSLRDGRYATHTRRKHRSPSGSVHAKALVSDDGPGQNDPRDHNSADGGSEVSSRDEARI